MTRERYPDVIVVGVGRSGTTNTARIVHDHFGICVGHVFAAARPGNAFDGGPGREDEWMIKYTLSLIKGHSTAEDWLRYWNVAHKNADCTATLRGTKQTHLAAATREQWLTIRPRLIIRTHRARELVVKSLHHHRRRRLFVWEEFYDIREGMMQETIDPADFPIEVVHVRYTEERMTDKALIDQLTPHIEELRR